MQLFPMVHNHRTSEWMFAMYRSSLLSYLSKDFRHVTRERTFDEESIGEDYVNSNRLYQNLSLLMLSFGHSEEIILV